MNHLGLERLVRAILDFVCRKSLYLAYDSRAVAFAFFWSPPARRVWDERIAAAKAAKNHGDEKQFKDLQVVMAADSKRSHLRAAAAGEAVDAEIVAGLLEVVVREDDVGDGINDRLPKRRFGYLGLVTKLFQTWRVSISGNQNVMRAPLGGTPGGIN